MTRTIITLLFLSLAAPFAASAQTDSMGPPDDSAAPAGEVAADAAEAPATQATEGSAPTEPVEAPPEAAPAIDDFRNAWVSLGLRAGVYVPGLVNAFDPHADLTVEVAVLLPFLDRMLGIYGDVNWAPPGASRSLTDPRVGPSGSDGTWTYSMQTDELFFSLGLIFRFLPPGSVFVPYISAGARVYLLRTTVNGTGNGNPFGENTEQSTQAGFTASLGGEIRLGPGAVLLDVGFGYSDLPHVITGGTSTTAIAVQLGYRLFL